MVTRRAALARFSHRGHGIALEGLMALSLAEGGKTLASLRALANM